MNAEWKWRVLTVYDGMVVTVCLDDDKYKVKKTKPSQVELLKKRYAAIKEKPNVDEDSVNHMYVERGYNRSADAEASNARKDQAARPYEDAEVAKSLGIFKK